MKTKILTFAFLLCLSFTASSQINFGVGGTYLNDLGVQVRADVPVSSFTLIPKASYYFIDNATALIFDLDAKYDLVNIGESNPLYAFGGLLYSRLSSGNFSSGDLGFNLGAGIRINHIYGEVRYSTVFCDNCNGDIGVAAGYMF